MENKLGESGFAPIEVYLEENNVLKHKIIFMVKSNFGIIKDGRVKATPNLIAEALSGNTKHDLQVNKVLYETFGVQEYFIISAGSKDVITY